MNDNALIADLLFPNLKFTAEDLEKKYPARDLPEGAKVTRFAPSPTGFIQIGNLSTALIAQRFARQTGGIFYLRIEDTDKKREVKKGVNEIIESLSRFDIHFDEGLDLKGNTIGNYGPYKQSERADIYKTFAKIMVEKGYAYPCFCSEEELDNVRKKQKEKKARPGYYGEWAVCRNNSIDKIKKQIEEGKSFVLRLKSPGKHENRIFCNDLIRGRLEMSENDLDIVLIKSDGIPPYHFAHVVDDHLMRTTDVVRGEEWLASYPIHIQLFQLLEWELPKYIHVVPLLKLDGASKRKISKRKDPEAAVSYYFEQGYNTATVIEYLLSLINSNFEEWRDKNPHEPYTNFIVSTKKMSLTGGAIFDIAKLTDVGRNVIALMKAEDIYYQSYLWAKEFDKELAALMQKYEDITKKALNLDREGKNPRKDIAKWTDLRQFIGYFYDELFYKEYNGQFDFPDNINKNDVKSVLKEYIDVYSKEDEQQEWFNKIKQLSAKVGFASEVKEYKNNPEAYKGHVGDVCMILRVVITGRQNAPDLYQIMNIIGYERIIKRLRKCLEIL